MAIPIGEVRPSQLLWTYGPGALIDLPNISAMTMGTEYWQADQCQPIVERRLLAAVQNQLGPQVHALLRPPLIPSDNVHPLDAAARIGVPVQPLPRWLRCVKCGLLSPFDAGLFSVKEDVYRPERTRFVHAGCTGRSGRASEADVVAARHMIACRAGHLDDFPWHYFVHKGNSSCQESLRFYEYEASMQTENLFVRCDCGESRTLAHAFGEAGKQNLPSCRGRHPHIGLYRPGCEEVAQPVLLNATNSWFPISLSALDIPFDASSPNTIVDEWWEDFEPVESEAELTGTVRALIRREAIPGLEDHSTAALWAAIEAKRDGGNAGNDSDDIKTPEWQVLIADETPNNYPHFLSSQVPVPSGFEHQIARVLLVERLREVNALIGFTRVESPDDIGDPTASSNRAPLSKDSPDWVPASEVHGEGIFIQFDENALQSWEGLAHTQKLDTKMRKAHRDWRLARGIAPNSAYPGVRFIAIHTLSHLLIRELSLECGYNAASIRERIYAVNDDAQAQAGLLIYTAAADSDGTLGGLVELGRPQNLERILRSALERSTICSSDPLCSEHDPEKDRSLHMAACHACLFVSETSCEAGNRYLDRTSVFETLAHSAAGFFSPINDHDV